MDSTDRKLLDAIQQDFPLTEHPFRDVGARLGLTEEDILARLRRLQDGGFVRRIGPILNPEKLGRTGALVAACVPEERLDEVAAIVSACSAVSHNYLREPLHGTCPCNVWFTVSADAQEGLVETVRRLEAATGVPLRLLPSRKKFKIGVRFALAEDHHGR